MLTEQDVLDDILLDHSLYPRYQSDYSLNEDDIAIGNNISCGDKITVYVQRDLDRIKKVSFSGHCCAIASSSASLMTVEASGKTIYEVKSLFERVRYALITESDSNDLLGRLMKQLLQSNNFMDMKVNRSYTCALLPWNTMLDAISGIDDKSHQPYRDYSLFLE